MLTARPRIRFIGSYKEAMKDPHGVGEIPKTADQQLTAPFLRFQDYKCSLKVLYWTTTSETIPPIGD
jgi:hypothetical protein